MGINYNGSQGQSERAVALQEEEEGGNRHPQDKGGSIILNPLVIV
jgi:hypothetical protein